jgi:hypothetical protein
MLLIRIGSNRLWIINEYWLFVPPMLVIEYLIIKKLYQLKKAKDEKEKAEDHKDSPSDFRNKCTQLKIFHVAMNNIVDGLRIRGGQELIEIAFTYKNCPVGKGFRYVESEHIRKLVSMFFRFKERGGVIFITQRALCHFVKKYGLLVLPSFVPSVIPLENLQIIVDVYQSIRKSLSVGLAGGSLALFVYTWWGFRLTSSPLSYLIQYLLTAVLAGCGVNLALTDLDYFPFIKTTLITGGVESIKRRIPDVLEVVSVDVDFENQPKIRYECWVPEMRLQNPTCRFSNEKIIKISNSIGLDYQNVVNMHDVTGLNTVEFLEKYSFNDRAQVPSSTEKLKPRVRGITVNLLEKFRDPQNIPESETWDIQTNSIQRIGKTDKVIPIKDN